MCGYRPSWGGNAMIWGEGESVRVQLARILLDSTSSSQLRINRQKILQTNDVFQIISRAKPGAARLVSLYVSECHWRKVPSDVDGLSPLTHTVLTHWLRFQYKGALDKFQITKVWPSLPL